MPEIIGHGDVLRYLTQLTARGALPHAVLFVGPPSVGKTTVCRWLAARLLCDAAGCGRCPACTQVERGVHPDVFHLATEGETIGIDAARAWGASLHQSSLLTGWKIGTVEGAEDLTIEAANAILKTLEEPPPKTLLLLTAASRRAVLATIASRCVTVRLHRVGGSELVDGLRRRGTNAADAEAAVAIADGCPGRAITWLKDPEVRTATERVRADADAVLGAPIADRLRFVERFVRALPDDRVAVRQAVRALLGAFRSIAQDLASHAASGRASVALADLIRCMAVLNRAPEYLAGNVSPRLVLEVVVLALP